MEVTEAEAQVAADVPAAERQEGNKKSFAGDVERHLGLLDSDS
jgi:hypothetical protein